MAEYAPQTLRDLYDKITVPSKEMSGIVGDSEHTYGYHRGRNFVGLADYSVVLAADKTGDGNAACALDVKLSASDMELVTNRLMTACRSGDPRAAALREFFGTKDGQRVTGWDRHDPAQSGDDTLTTSDSSHLWHIHLSIYRSMVGSAQLVAQLAGIINGVPLPPAPKPVPAPATVPHLHRAWPSYMKTGNYFGLLTGPVTSHGGYYASERADVAAIQKRLDALGFHPGVVDGQFGPATARAVSAWQHAHMPGTTFYGQVWTDDWRKLFTY